MQVILVKNLEVLKTNRYNEVIKKKGEMRVDQIIKIGIGVMIKKQNQVLLGHRTQKAKDTGGIYEPDSWTFPGGKQEYDETMQECAIREVKEETNLDISNLEIFCATDDIQPNKHYITIQIIANQFVGDLKVMEKDKIDEWKWFDLENLPENLYSPTKKFIENYQKKRFANEF